MGIGPERGYERGCFGRPQGLGCRVLQQRPGPVVEEAT